MSTDALLTSHQAALLLGKRTRWVQRKAASGELPYAQKLPGPNGAYLYRQADVEALREPATAGAA